MAKEQATGLSIHGGMLRWTVMRSAKGGAPVVSESRNTPLQLEAGDAPDMTALSEADSAALVPQLRTIRGSVQGRATVALSSEHVLMRSVELPAVDPAELRSMVELQADKFSPFPTESAVTSYETVLQTETSSRVVMATAQRQNVEAVGSMFLQAGIIPRRMDVETLCWWRLITDAGAAVGPGCSIVILKDKAVCDLIVTMEGAPVIIRGLGKTGNLSDEDICSELEYTLNSLENEHGVGQADSIRLWHWDEEPSTLVRMLREKFSSDVQSALFKSLPPLTEGMARRTLDESRENLDLSIPEWEAGQRVVRLRKQLVNASIAAVALWIALFGGFFALLQYDKKRVDPLEARAAELMKMEAREAAARDLLFAAKQYADIKYSAIACLREVVRLKPADLEFDKFVYKKALQRSRATAQSGTHRGNTRTNGVVMVEGHAPAQNTILDFEKDLHSPPALFTRVDLGKMTQTSTKGQNAFKFKMTLELPIGKNDETP